MGLADPKNPLFVNPGGAAPIDPSRTAIIAGKTAINQIRGITVNGSTGAGIPKPVTNVQANVSNGSAGATSVINIQFRRDPSDQAFAGVRILAKGYQGNSTAVQVGSSVESPATVILNNTGEAISLTVQAYGNGGNAPLSQCPSVGVQLPKSAGGGMGVTTTTQIVTQASAASASLSLVSNTLVVQGTSIASPSALNVSTEGTYDWLCCSTRGMSAAADFADPQTYRWKKSRTGLWYALSWNANSNLSPSFISSGPFSVSANSGDDAGLGTGGDNTTFPLTSSRVIIGAFQNNTTVIPQGYSWTLRIPLYAGARTINVYHGNRAQINKTALSTITAHTMDGSAPDVSTTCPNAGSASGANIAGYKTVFHANASVFTYLMITSVFTSTGTTTLSGDGLLWCACTIS